ncbi:hypothetical protein E5288_WYG016378 [Bos mutus]|uniref:Uncharacterized protein n=1 Tax=Bos mutus TaxID=72004 RepID=A0A6B0R7R0_9CETA|nr:hypothetical protein [Bos mutus]
MRTAPYFNRKQYLGVVYTIYSLFWEYLQTHDRLLQDLDTLHPHGIVSVARKVRTPTGILFPFKKAKIKICTSWPLASYERTSPKKTSGQEVGFLSSSRMSATEQARFPESEAMNRMCSDFHTWRRGAHPTSHRTKAKSLLHLTTTDICSLLSSCTNSPATSNPSQFPHPQPHDHPQQQNHTEKRLTIHTEARQEKAEPRQITVGLLGKMSQGPEQNREKAETQNIKPREVSLLHHGVLVNPQQLAISSGGPPGRSSGSREPTPAVSAHTSPHCRTYSVPPDVPLPYVQRTTGRPPAVRTAYHRTPGPAVPSASSPDLPPHPHA